MSSKRLQDSSSRRQYGTSHGVTYRPVWGRPQDVTLGRPLDVIFQRPKDVGRGCLQDVGRDVPLALHRRPYGDVHTTSFRVVLRTVLGRNFAERVPDVLQNRCSLKFRKFHKTNMCVGISFVINLQK